MFSPRTDGALGRPLASFSLPLFLALPGALLFFVLQARLHLPHSPSACPLPCSLTPLNHSSQTVSLGEWRRISCWLQWRSFPLVTLGMLAIISTPPEPQRSRRLPLPQPLPGPPYTAVLLCSCSPHIILTWPKIPAPQEMNTFTSTGITPPIPRPSHTGTRTLLLKWWRGQWPSDPQLLSLLLLR